jgi:tRNA (guanine37-N1)-methyltransferase
VGEVYFSVRLSTERSRLASLVKPGERVLVMFSGCGPYTCVFGKNTKAKEIIGVEWNPLGHQYALENIKLNKLNNCSSFCGSVKDVLPTLTGTFDRILMPLPKTADDFLDVALSKAHKGTVIHFYDFLNEKEFHLAHEKIDAACKRAKIKYNISQTIKCGQHAPYVFRICVDFEVS